MAARNEDRFGRLEAGQRETNRRLGKIEETLATSSRIFELMHERLGHLETGQERLVAVTERVLGRLDSLEAGQERVIDRLDRLVEATIRGRTSSVERVGRIEERLDRLEATVFPGAPR